MKAYIEIMSTVCMWEFRLDDFDLRAIGEFTRENIAAWLNRGNCRFEIGVYGYEDFHAVCGDIDIPWATKEAKVCWEIVYVRAARPLNVTLTRDGSPPSWVVEHFNEHYIEIVRTLDAGSSYMFKEPDGKNITINSCG